MSTSVDYMHICDYAFLADGKKQSVVGIFDRINASTFPAAHPYMAVAIKLRDEPHRSLSVTVALARPSGEKLAELNGSVATGDDGSAFLNVNLVGIQFPEPGRYLVKVTSGGQTLVSQSLMLAKVEVPQPALSH